MSKGKDWQEIKLLIVPIIWLAATIFVVVNFILPVMKQYWMLLLGDFVACIFISIFLMKVWWYKEPFKGIDINVREPHVGFAKMPYKVDPAEVGTNPFGAAFAWHFSSFLVPIEAAIHLFMGNDMQRASQDGNNEACIGMMTQEMNHGIAQLFYSREVEKCLGYPKGYRSLWKTILIRYLSRKWAAALLVWIEIAFMPFQLAVTFLPIKLEHLFGEPAWLWNWHFMEESEHSWEYVHETSPKIPFLYKAVTFFVVAFGILCFWVQAILQGLWYGSATFHKHPSRLITGLFMHVTFFAQCLLFAITFTLLESILGMRPDEAYQWARDGLSCEFAEYSHLFKITHTQRPGGHLIKKTKTMPPRSSILGVQVERQRLYNKVREMMKTRGMTEKEIKRTSFGHVAEASKFNPLLC